jgi:hypothetical protein
VAVAVAATVVPGVTIGGTATGIADPVLRTRVMPPVPAPHQRPMALSRHPMIALARTRQRRIGRLVVTTGRRVVTATADTVVKVAGHARIEDRVATIAPAARHSPG